MTKKDVFKYAPISGVATVGVSLAVKLTGLLDYPTWLIALSFPLGAGAYLFVEFLSEKVGVS
jgi:hypothetical protein